MRRALAVLSLILWCALCAHGQGASGSMTAQGATCAVSNACVVTPTLPASSGGASFTLSGTWSATVQFEASGDNQTTWVALNVTPTNSTTAVTSATGNGTWQANVAGYTNVRLRVSAFTSGTVVGTINISYASARANGGGGGGGGTVTAVTGTAPIVSSGGTTPAISCATCTTSAAALINNSVVIGAGGQAEQTLSGFTTDGSKELDLGTAGTTSGVLGLNGSTSGKATITAPAVGGTATNPLTLTNGLALPLNGATSPAYCFTNGSGGCVTHLGFTSDGSNLIISTSGDTVTFQNSGNNIFAISSTAFNVGFNDPLISITAPTIAAAGCGGAAASITSNNGTAAFKVGVGTSNTGTCTVTMPTATTDWICSATDITTTSANVAITKSVPTTAHLTNEITLQNYSDVAVAHAWVDSDVIAISCFAE